MRVCACNICDTVCVNVPIGGTHSGCKNLVNLMKMVESYFFVFCEIGNS